jgi:multicomponent Na+:H+ antiporter subunit D
MSTGAQELAPLAIAVPIVISCALVGAGRHLPRPVLDGGTLLTAVAVAALDAIMLAATHGGRIVTWSGGWTPRDGVTVGIALVVDGLGAGMALLGAILVACAVLYGWRYFEDVETHYHVMLLLFLAGMTGFALTGDLFDMLVFFELMGAMAYALTAFKIEDKIAVQGGLNFAVVNSFGAYLTLMGIGLVYSRTGQLGLAQVSSALAGRPPDALIVAAFVLVCTGWLVKAAAVPFHFWTADAEAVAPSPVCALFSGAMVELGVYGVARAYWTVFRHALPSHVVERALLVVGVLTALVGAVMCVAQRNLKRMLAYSTIAHVGLFITAVATLTAGGLTGAAIYAAGHAGVKGSLFLLAGIVLNRYGNVDELELHGRGRRDELLAWLMVLDGLALAGLPPFGTGLGKAVAEDAVGAAGFVGGPALFVAVSALTGGAVLRVSARIFFGLGVPPSELASSAKEMTGDNEPETSGRLHRIPPTMLAAVLVLMLGSLAVGTMPGLGRSVAGAAERFVESDGYVAQVLHGSRPLPLHPENVGWTASGALLGVLSAVLAVGVATIGLQFRRLPSAFRKVAGPGRPVLDALHDLHSGHIGDYVAWLFVGVAGLSALVGLPVLI